DGMKRNTIMLGLALTVAARAAAVSLGWRPARAGRAAAAPRAPARPPPHHRCRAGRPRLHGSRPATKCSACA
ncbi:hypothetical protein ACIP6X_41810, partial [Streptomyces coeruleorubidus]|uniref:hypothetical protein n=1 Tax=Streptomyces coeruleorubidus TaxID=116188 RepID=UPI0037F89B76